MKQAHFSFLFSLWFFITCFTAMGYYSSWVGGTRVPGRLLGRVPLLGSVGRRGARSRLNTVRGDLGASSEYQVLVEEPLLKQVQGHATWARLSRIFLMAPGGVALFAFAFVLTPSAGHTPPPWLTAFFMTLFLVSLCLTGVEIRAVRNADSAGLVSVAAVAVLEAFTTRVEKCPPKSTPALWQSGLIEELCTALVRRAQRESLGAVPASRQDMTNDTARLIRALRHRVALVHSGDEGEVREAREHELFALLCGILRYSSRPRDRVRDFRVIEADCLGDAPDIADDEATVPSLKARVLIPLVFLCAIISLAVALSLTGVAGEYAPYVVVAMAAAATPLANRFQVTVFDALLEPPALPAAPRQAEPQPTPEPVRRAA